MNSSEKMTELDSVPICDLAKAILMTMLMDIYGEFNRFLDRALVIGSLERPDIGYFNAGDLE